MIGYLKSHKKIITDFLYSIIAYALPTIVLQFVVQPLIAGRTSADDNGMFVTLFNVVKLMIGVFVLPLANLRLIKKQECEKAPVLNSFFNSLFLAAILATALVGTLLNGFYRKFSLTAANVLLLLAILLLMAVHDYFMIAFRLVLNYKKIVADNCLIVAGYGLGILLFIKTGLWELIFICGYVLGTAFVLMNTDLWKSKPGLKEGKHLVRQYGELSASDLLKNASTYCDRLIIFPILGGFSVSVYNAAAVVSKAISVISAPLRNVLLSYIVNRSEMSLSRRKMRRLVPLALLAFAAVFFGFWGFSILACRFLYPQYAAAAAPYIPLITLAIMIETLGAVLNIILLRFAKTRLQTIISGLKLGVYLLVILVLDVIMNTGLWGFCAAILIADLAFCITVVVGVRKSIVFTE